ncbi:hypothetical protein KUTeg_015913 [Tegillarca granosa]|uniref:Ig-like domain-containing protein n=1 Tax=Tegillarca granosa TaxID=220873 RepID=A0ABQ9EQ18_TEGGR|nr:hypothetical protein KUTeg_015913 [Tegillarca granosa]
MIRLDLNPLRCDCDMLWLAEKLRQSQSRIQAAATCRQPRRFQGRALSSITSSNLECVSETPLRFTVEPSDVSVSLGNTVFFPCRASGTPTPNIVWLHNE